MWAAIAISAVIFGVLHLPTTAALIGRLTQPVIIYVVAGNALFGLMTGYLFWRHGLEAAIIAHASAHVIAWLGAALQR